jgi:hypothetical protein
MRTEIGKFTKQYWTSDPVHYSLNITVNKLTQNQLLMSSCKYNWVVLNVTLSLGLLSPPNLSFSGISKVSKFY